MNKHTKKQKNIQSGKQWAWLFNFPFLFDQSSENCSISNTAFNYCNAVIINMTTCPQRDYIVLKMSVFILLPFDAGVIMLILFSEILSFKVEWALSLWINTLTYLFKQFMLYERGSYVYFLSIRLQTMEQPLWSR